MKKHGLILCLATAFLAASCDMAGDESNDGVKTPVYLDDVAELLAQLPLEKMHLQEVYDAVSSSSYNGYDEEYTMLNLFENPGAGVGDKSSKAPTVYERPLRQLIDEQVRTMAVTKTDSMDPDEFIETLTYSDIQIYWPYSEEWDGNEMPIITFDPENGSDVNIGYRLVIDDDGFRHVAAANQTDGFQGVSLPGHKAEERRLNMYLEGQIKLTWLRSHEREGTCHRAFGINSKLQKQQTYNVSSLKEHTNSLARR